MIPRTPRRRRRREALPRVHRQVADATATVAVHPRTRQPAPHTRGRRRPAARTPSGLRETVADADRVGAHPEATGNRSRVSRFRPWAPGRMLGMMRGRRLRSISGMRVAEHDGSSRERVRREIARRRTFAIISHPDAGKTTLTEKLLLYVRGVRRDRAARTEARRYGSGSIERRRPTQPSEEHMAQATSAAPRPRWSRPAS